MITFARSPFPPAAPMYVALALLLIATLSLWVYGEVADVRPARTLANVALLAGTGFVGYAVGAVGASFNLGNEYALRLEPFRAAAVERLEAGECDRVLAELRALEGQLTYESGLTFRVLKEGTARLNEAREEAASNARGADASPLAETAEGG